MKIVGFRDHQIRRANVDDRFRMDAGHLADLVKRDIASGIHRHSFAQQSERPLHWLLTNFDCDLFYIANKADLVSALTLTPEFLRNKATESGAVFDYSGWQVSLGRRFRSLKLWLVIRHYGVEGLRSHIRSHIELAREFTSWIEADDEYQLFQPTSLNPICFQHCEGNEKSKQILEKLNDSNKLFLTHTILNDTYVIRIALGAMRTEMRHIETAWQEIKKAARS